MVSTDKDPGRLKILCRVPFYILSLVSVVVTAVLALIGVALVWEFLDPRFIGEEAPEFPLAVLAILMGVLLLFPVVYVMLLNIVRSICCKYSPFMIKNVRCLEVIGMAHLVFPVVVSPLLYLAFGDITATEVISIILSCVLMARIFYCLSLVFFTDTSFRRSPTKRSDGGGAWR